MTKTKYLLYAFKYQQDKKYTYWYETDNKFFQSTKPLKIILDKNPREIDNLNSEDIIENPWEEWISNDIQKIIASNGVCINYLKSTEHDFIQTLEDKKLLEMYVYLVENFDKDFINNEFKELTTIGNTYNIRHHEKGKIIISENKHIEYLFFRMLALLNLCVENIHEKEGI